MPLPLTLMLLATMLVAALLLQPLARYLQLPFALLLVLAGFAGSELFVGLGHDTGLRARSFRDLIVYVFLPVLIFESALRIDVKSLAHDLACILILAIPMLLLAIVATAALLYWGIGHPAGFPWIAALLTSALLSATDPAAVLDLLRRLRVTARLPLLLEGESLFNDATAIVLFSIFLSLALHPGETVTLGNAAQHFGLLTFGGAFVGLVVGLIFLLLLRFFNDPVELGLLTIISAYAAFLAGEWVLQLSGVVSVLVTGLIVGNRLRRDQGTRQGGFVGNLWGLNAFVANALVFLLMGVTITLPMFEQRWLAMLIGIGAVLCARAVALFALLPLAGRLPGIEPVPVKTLMVLHWGGLRGAITLALALSLPVDLAYWWTIQSIAFGVVLFALTLQAPTLALLVRHLSLADEKLAGK